MFHSVVRHLVFLCLLLQFWLQFTCVHIYSRYYFFPPNHKEYLLLVSSFRKALVTLCVWDAVFCYSLHFIRSVLPAHLEHLHTQYIRQRVKLTFICKMLCFGYIIHFIWPELLVHYLFITCLLLVHLEHHN